MTDEPVILLEGPHSVGKSTLLRGLADSHGATVLDLDDLATRDAVAEEPATFVAGPAPDCVDEYRKAPAVPDAMTVYPLSQGELAGAREHFLAALFSDLRAVVSGEGSTPPGTGTSSGSSPGASP